MGERDERRAAERIDRLVGDVLSGRHLKATPSDAAERDAIMVATRLAGVRDGYPRMSSAFRRRLSGLLETGELPTGMNRRAALAAGLGLAAGAVGGAVAGPLAGHFEGLVAAHRPAPAASPEPAHGQPAATRAIVEPRAELGRWWDTGLQLTDLVEGIPHKVTAGAIGAFLVRKRDTVTGMSSLCTHLPCELIWQEDTKLLNCPCHNLAFDVEGQSTREGYALPALPYVRVRVRTDGRVEVLGT
jgi:nitrite reductase/ring-hydroxylating ferredoxin subunit